MKKLILPAILLSTLGAGAQLTIESGATFFIDNGAVVTVQGDVTSNASIQVNGAAGTGKLRLGGSTTQNVNMNGFTVPNLQIDNSAANAVLTSAATVSNSLEFTNGKLQLANFDLTLSPAATSTGAAAGKFAETNGTGVVKKLLTAATVGFSLPVGSGANYTPLSYTTTGGTYNASTFVAARVIAGAHPQKHPRSTDYLNSYWKLSNNIAGATIISAGTFPGSDITGTQPPIVSMYWNGTNWVRGTAETATTVTAAATANSSNDLYGMNKFILANVKTFLQGAYDATVPGTMTDLLRTLPTTTDPASKAGFPLKNPYNYAPYVTAFTSVDNAVEEVIDASVLATQANTNDNIVDWVFLELRTNATPSTVIKTRAALIQKDGDIVDIDGKSPVYFKDADPSTSNISIRHRNHLAVRTANGLSLNLIGAKSDLSTSAANYLGSFAIALPNGLFGLYGGNANVNNNVRISGPNATVSDFTYLKQEIGALSQIANTYSPSDLNLNKSVRVSGPNSTVSDFIKMKEIIGSNASITQPAQ